MKKHDRVLISLFFISLFIVIIFDVIAKDYPEWFDGGAELVDIAVNVSLSCVAGCIIYFISSYLPMRENELQKAQDQAKVDEIIASRLRSMLDSISRIFITSYNEMSMFEDIVVNPLSEDRFKELTVNVCPSDISVIGRANINSTSNERTLMNVEELISEEISNLNYDVEKLLQLERFLSAELIKCISELEETSIISNWQLLMDSKPIIIAGEKYFSPKGVIANYSSQFKGLDEKYRVLQKLMLDFKHTNSGEITVAP